MSNLIPMLLAQGDRADDSNMGFWAMLWIAVIVFGLIFSVVALIVIATYGKLWFQAYMSDADVTMLSLIGMGFRQVDTKVVMTAKIMCSQAGMDINRRSGISTQRLEAHYLAGGNVMNVINAIIAASETLLTKVVAPATPAPASLAKLYRSLRQSVVLEAPAK